MAEPFLGEIRLLAFDFAPRNWTTCDGQTLSIVQNQALFALLGTTYGGNGTSNFNLPDLQGRTVMHRSTTPPIYDLGEAGGSETVVLNATTQLPAHTHMLAANSGSGSGNNPTNTVLAAVADTTKFAYATSKTSSVLAAGSVATAGISAGHDNMQPSLAINFCLALTGYFPSRS
jgi:microcystin-dependent protein